MKKKMKKKILPGLSRHTRLERAIVVDPQLLPLLHLLHLEVLMVAGLVVVTRVVVVVRAIVWARSLVF